MYYPTSAHIASLRRRRMRRERWEATCRRMSAHKTAFRILLQSVSYDKCLSFAYLQHPRGLYQPHSSQITQPGTQTRTSRGHESPAARTDQQLCHTHTETHTHTHTHRHTHTNTHTHTCSVLIIETDTGESHVCLLHMRM